MDILQPSTTENITHSEVPYFDFVNPKAPIDTDIREGEKYQEYVDRMVAEYPTEWQKNILSYYALTIPILMLYAQGVRDPKSVETLGIFDSTALEQTQGMHAGSISDLDGCNIKLNPDYRIKLLSQGSLCIHGFSELKRQVEQVERSEFEEKESMKKGSLFNRLFGLYEEKDADHAKYMYLETQRTINGQLIRYLTGFKDAQARLTEKEIVNYGDIWNIASGELQEITFQLGVSRSVMENILDLSKTLSN